MTLSMEQHIDIDDSQMVVYGYRKSGWRTVLVYIISTLTCGVPCLLFHWWPTWLLYATSVRACFQLADQVLVVETYQKKCKSFYIHKILDKNVADSNGLLNKGFQDEFGEKKEPIDSAEDLCTPIHLDDGSTLNIHRYRYFRHKKQTLIWDGARAHWTRLAGIESGATCAMLQARGARAPSTEKRVRMLNIYGLNEIKVPVQSIMTLVLLEVFNPFYVFQLFTIAVWLAEPYYYYCVAVVLMSTFGVATSVIQTKKNQQSLRATVEAHDTVQLWDGRVVDSARVAPGDIVVLPQRGCTLHFDAALLTAAAIVNESMLTGESVPVTKTALLRTDQPFDLKQHASSVLFCGTRVIQTRYYNNEPVKALVLRTGYNTSKGQLVRSILYPVPADFKFDRDSYKFIIILAGIALVGLAYTVALKAYRALTPGDIAIKALDIITIVIPPALPAAMTVGRLYAVARLKNARIACLNTRAVNVSGSLDCVCFDKTGTLTEDGLDMWGVVATSAATSPPRLGRPLRDPAQLNDLHDLKLGMACCHSLTLLDGELAGDPLDLKMFESTGWKLEEPDVPEHSNYDILTPTIVKPKKTANINVDDIHMPLELGIVQQHQFVSSLQRSSVCVRMLGEDVLRVYCKGAPEMLRTLCRPHTVPDNLNEVLNSYAEKGYRVIAVATRILEVNFQQLQRMTREEVERELEFLGLVIMENRLKAATTGIIRELKEANIHVVMITGDNIHTAVSVARECGILANDERVVVLHADTGGHTPIIYCESTLHGATVGRRTALQREWRSVDSGRGSWRGSGSNSCELDAEAAGDVKYKVVMTGDTWHVLREQYPCMVGRVIARGAVFARMTSDQKQQLIVEYQALGYYVVPDNLNEVLNSYAEKGYRVIAVATRILEVNFQQLQRMTRDEVERELEFLGLVIMENRLKAATTGIIRELKEANIHVVMITGDNIHTAVSVARECGILASDERVVVLHADTAGHTPVIYCESTLHGATVGRRTPLQREWRSVDSGRGSWRGSGSNSCELDAEAAGDVKYKVVMTGDTWHVLREQYPCMVGRVIARGAVFARMTSDQKQQLIVEYQALGYYVGMCGDGANDCGALRAAHTGISLSELESSVAAPFTSADPDIVCVSRVLREGRAALTTSFGVFKFMISYSLTEFLSVAFLYYFDSNLTDFQFLYIDVALIVNFAFFFGMTEAYTGKLCKVPPLTSLLGLVPLLSLIGQLVLIAVAQFLSYYALTFFPWYERHTYEGDEANECWENYAIFTVSMFQYITMSIVFSHGSPYRRSIVTNKQLMISILIMLGICIYITVAPAQWLAEFLQLRMPLNALMCYIILALAAFNFVIALFFERVIVQFLMERKEMIPKFLKEKRVMKTPHLLLKRQLTDMDYLDCDSLIKYEKEIYSAISDSSSGKGS